MLKIFKKIYFKFLKNNRNITVYLRGKLSDQQSLFYKNLSKKYIINKKDLKSYLGQYNILEIGFGNGHHIIDLANNNKDKNIFGSELYKEGILNTFLKIDKNNISNIKILDIDARDIIKYLNKSFLNELYILFPDPWQKARHKKRRILQKDFIRQCIDKTNNKIIIATDWNDYANMISENLISLDQHLDKNIQEIEKYNKKNKIYIYHNNNYNITKDQKIIQDILNTTFAKRAIIDDRNVNVFIITK